ncbi:MAG: PepSY domain-containing protein [Pseudomonadota bacterium]
MNHTWPHMIVAATALSFLNGAALAEPHDKPPLASPLTFDQAIAIALAEQPGEVFEIALERHDARVVTDIEVVNEAGHEVEFTLDARTGEILSTKIDDEPSDDPGEGKEEDSDD